MSRDHITVIRLRCDRCDAVVENPEQNVKNQWGWLAFEGCGSDGYGYAHTNREEWGDEHPDVCPACLKEAHDWWSAGRKA